MIKPLSRGAFARAVFVALCLFLVQAFAVTPHACAATLTPIWAFVPGDDYRGKVDSFLTPLHPPRGAAEENLQSATGAFARGAVAALVRAKAEALGVPVALAVAITRFESGLRMSMQGAAGERGAMQVLPQTARQVGVTGNLYGPAGIEAGVRYLKLALALHRGAGWCAVASAYNSGVWRGPHCTRYGRMVTAMAARP